LNDLEFSIALNGVPQWSCVPADRPALASVLWNRRDPAKGFGPRWLPSRLTDSLVEMSGTGERLVARLRAALQPEGRAAHETRGVSLAEHVRGTPRASWGAGFTDVEPATPSLFGLRLLSPRAAQGLAGGEVLHGDTVTIRLGRGASPHHETPRVHGPLDPYAPVRIEARVEVGSEPELAVCHGRYGHYALFVHISTKGECTHMEVISQGHLDGERQTRRWEVCVDEATVTLSCASADDGGG